MTNWLLVEGRLCYLQGSRVSDRSRGLGGRYGMVWYGMVWGVEGAGPRPIVVILGPHHRPPDPTIDSQDPDAHLFLVHFHKCNFLRERNVVTMMHLKVCEDMLRMFVPLSQHCVLCCHCLILGCCQCAFCELCLGWTPAHSEDITLKYIASHRTAS